MRLSAFSYSTLLEFIFRITEFVLRNSTVSTGVEKRYYTDCYAVSFNGTIYPISHVHLMLNDHTGDVNDEGFLFLAPAPGGPR